MPAKLERCLRKVRAQNRKKGTHYNPYAVCSASTGIKRAKGGGWTEGKPRTRGNSKGNESRRKGRKR